MMLSKAGERGAVNILFLVFVLVIALAFGGLWFVQLQENEGLKADAESANALYVAEQAKVEFLRAWYGEWAPLVGAGVPSELPAPSDESPRDIGKKIAQGIRQVTAAVGPRVGDSAAGSITVLAEVIEVPIARYNVMKDKVAELETTVANQKASIDGLNDTIAANEAAHVAARQTIQDDASANESRLNAQLDRAREESDAATAAASQYQDANETARREHEQERRTLTNEKRELDGNVRALKSARRLERQRQGPDGKVLSIDPRTGIVFIDLAAGDQLHAGTRFAVYGVGKGGDKISKGFLTVINTGVNMSEARVDQLRPGMEVESGDLIINPVFNKERPVRFVFLGELPGRYTREMAESILRNQGAKVDAETTTETDFLVLGQNESEDDLPLEESDSYRNAKRWGIHIITEKDLAPFLKQ